MSDDPSEEAVEAASTAYWDTAAAASKEQFGPIVPWAVAPIWSKEQTRARIAASLAAASPLMRAKWESDWTAAKSLVAERDAYRSALRYIERPTMGLAYGATPEAFARDTATDELVRAALTTCIRMARAALSAHQEAPNG